MTIEPKTIIPKFYCPVCFIVVLPTPTGYLCTTCGVIEIWQVLSERVAELRRKKRDEREDMS